jgi:hypothetical protein
VFVWIVLCYKLKENAYLYFWIVLCYKLKEIKICSHFKICVIDIFNV